MSALGDYIHLSAQGYRSSGTLRNWGNRSNYGSRNDKTDLNVFNNFIKNINNRVKKIDKFKNNGILKEAQKAYNEERQKNFNFIKKLFEDSKNKDNKFASLFTKALLEAANIKYLDEEIFSKVLEFDTDESEKATAKGIQLSKKAFSTAGGIKRISPFRGKNYSYLDTLKHRLNDLKGQIDAAKAQLKDENEKACFEVILNEYEILKTNVENIVDQKNKNLSKDIIKKLPNLEQKKLLKYMNGVEGQYLKFLSNGKILISSFVIDYFYTRIQEISNQLKVTRLLKNIQAAFSEIMAGLTGQNIEFLAEDALINTIKNASKGTDTAKVSLRVEEQAKKAIERYSLNNDIFNLDITSNTAAGKIDAIFTLNGEKYYASVKNYNLSNETYFNKNLGKNVPATITLVKGTPLTNLLLIAEGYQKHLGTHFLNILTEKTGENTILQARMTGMAALRLFLIYVGLTGGHGDLSLRDTQGVNILIIEDKASKKAYFFSISMIMESALRDMDSFVTTSNDKPLRELILNNTKVEIPLGGTIENAIDIRIKNVLEEAHKQKLYAGITHGYINKTIQNRKF